MVELRRRRLFSHAMALTLLPGLAEAQPAGRPTRILVGFSAGGGNDVVARILAQKLSDGPLAPVLVENRTGASGLIAADLLAKAPPDGATLMIASQTTYAIAPLLYKSATFDAQRDVAGVAMLGASPLVLVTGPTFPANSVSELIGMAKAKPGALNFASGGVGTTPHMAAEFFLFNAHIRMTHVSYRGEAPAIADVMAGQVPVLFANVSAVTGQVKSGALRALAVTSAKRAPSLPTVPTLAESGLPNSEVETWFGLAAPAATPRDTINRLNAEVRRVLALADMQLRFAELSMSVIPSSPEELDAMIKAEAARWGEVIRHAGIKAAE